jgi:hypothetical protein
MYCTVLLYALRSTGRAESSTTTMYYGVLLYALRCTGRAVEQYYYYVLYCTALRATLYW